MPTDDAKIDDLRRRLESLRARSPKAPPPRPRNATSVFKFDEGVTVPLESSSSPASGGRRRVDGTSASPRSPTGRGVGGGEDHADVDAALAQLETLSETVPAVRRVLEMIRRGPDGRVTVESFARAAEALRELSSVAGTSGAAGMPAGSRDTRPSPLKMSSPAAFGGERTSPRIVSPSGVRRSMSPIGPAQRVPVSSPNARVVREPVTVAATAPPMESDVTETQRLQEWSAHVRASKRVEEDARFVERVREEMFGQWTAFLTAGTAPADPFVGALAQQWMDSLKEKEDMVGGVNKARHVIEMLAESDKAKTKAIEALSDEILRLGGTVPEIANQGVEWSAEAFEQMGM
jgi:hypothetical protein